MPLPVAFVAPIAMRLAQLGAAAAVGALIASRRGPERVDIASEDTLDRIAEGGELRVDASNGRADAEGRFARVVRLGRHGPGFAIEAAALGRLKIQRLRKGR